MKKLFLLAILSLGGCAFLSPIAPMVQIGLYWVQGEAHKYYNNDQKTVLEAVKKSLAELDIKVKEEVAYKNYIFVKADERFKIKVHYIKENITKLSIRVATFGDKPYAELVYAHVDKQSGIKQVTELETKL